MSKLNKEAIDEITYLLNEVKDVVELMSGFDIHITSDPWLGTSFNDKENILTWERKDFENFNEIDDGDKFYIGGNVITGSQHQYKDKWIIAPKELAEVQGNIFKRCLCSIIKTNSFKHFDLKFKDRYGLVDNCGWEHWLIIETTVKPSALTNNNTKNLLKKIKNEGDNIIELSASPVYEEPKNEFSKESGLQPQGDFAYMVEFFSWNLIDPSEKKYQGCFSQYDYNGKYIRDCMKLINDVERRAEELADKYKEKGVKVTVNDFNEGCQYGMAIYVWIPYQ